MIRRPDVSHNVIALAELRYQRHVIRTAQSGPAWIALALAMLAPALLTALISILLAAMNATVGVDSIDLPALETGIRLDSLLGSLTDIGVAALFVMNIALYFVVVLVTMGLANRSVTRERDNRTWDVLRLTHVSARQIVWGKFWGSLMAMWGDHMILVVLRLGMVAMVLLGAPKAFNLPYLIYLGLFLLAFTVLDAALSIALAISSSVGGASASVTLPILLTLRFVLMLLVMVGFPVLMFIMMGADLPRLLLVTLVLLAVMVLLTVVTLWVGQALAAHVGLVSPADVRDAPLRSQPQPDFA